MTSWIEDATRPSTEESAVVDALRRSTRDHALPEISVSGHGTAAAAAPCGRALRLGAESADAGTPWRTASTPTCGTRAPH
ncbi:hypothetical protein [Streptomyces panaciradicis]|uniref:hypothetical protein n=1 Tax=Streptomyces panaciradicis TaxID=1470261 RepID=UPI00201D0A11|nr:hypothetical protein [Streptomyces panaciradicis]MCL6671883.1 hypothetical protein [Streptomyces panaciradicis]